MLSIREITNKRRSTENIGKNIFDESWIKGAQSSPIQGSEGADDHETHDYH